MSKEDDLFEEYFVEFFGGPKQQRQKTLHRNKQSYFDNLTKNLSRKVIDDEELDHLNYSIIEWLDSLN